MGYFIWVWMVDNAAIWVWVSHCPAPTLASCCRHILNVKWAALVKSRHSSPDLSWLKNSVYLMTWGQDICPDRLRPSHWSIELMLASYWSIISVTFYPIDRSFFVLTINQLTPQIVMLLMYPRESMRSKSRWSYSVLWQMLSVKNVFKTLLGVVFTA